MQNNNGDYLKKLLQVIKQIWLQMTFFTMSSQLITQILYFFQSDEDILQSNERYLDGELSTMLVELDGPFI